jgi:cardiolipin synthase
MIMKSPHADPSAPLAPDRARFEQLVESVTGSPFRAANRVVILQNGDEIFPPMLEAINSAQSSIEFLSYVFWRSEVASGFADALCRKAKSGVKVRLLIDAVGAASISARTIWNLERAGVQVGWFRPGRWKYLNRLNNRTHRKILLVDGQVGFTGGVGIADIWTGYAQDRRHWRETHCLIEGPACDDLHAGFADSWLEATGETLAPTGAKPAGHISVQTTISTAGLRPTAAERLVAAVFANAQHRLWITSAYFVPTPALRRELMAAATRGVDVRVLTNGPQTNHKITRLAGRATYRRLLEAGVRIFEYRPTVHHAKVITADSAWATIGSTNIDARSLILNDELNSSFTDSDLVAELDRQFITDLEQADEIHIPAWLRRSRLSRLVEFGSSLFAKQL